MMYSALWLCWLGVRETIRSRTTSYLQRLPNET